MPRDRDLLEASMWSPVEYREQLRKLRKLVRLVRSYRYLRRTVWRVLDERTSIATISIEDLMLNTIECFDDEETAKQLDFTCGFMSMKWFLETIGETQ